VLWRSGLLLGLGRERVEEDGDAVSVAAAPTASPVTAALPRQELPSIAARRTATATVRDDLQKGPSHHHDDHERETQTTSSSPRRTIATMFPTMDAS